MKNIKVTGSAVATDTGSARETDTGSALETDTGGALEKVTGSGTDTDIGSGREMDTGSGMGEDEHYYDIADDYPPEEDLKFETRVRLKVETYIGSKHLEHLKSLGHQEKNFIIDCTWKGLSCSGRYEL